MHGALIPTTEVDELIIVRAAAFAGKVQRMMARDVLRDEGLAVLEWRLLFAVARFGSCHMAFITRKTSIDPAHGSRAVTALEARGLLLRSSDPKNKRRKLISITPEGQKVFNRVWPKARQTTRKVTDGLNEHEFNELKRIFDLINDAADALLEAEQSNIDTKEDALAAAHA